MNWFKRLFKKAPVKPVFERRRWMNQDFSIGKSFWINGKKVSYEQWFCEKHNEPYIPKSVEGDTVKNLIDILLGM